MQSLCLTDLHKVFENAQCSLPQMTAQNGRNIRQAATRDIFAAFAFFWVKLSKWVDI